MKIDLFMEFPSPPDAELTLSGVIEDGLGLVRAADALGFDAVWLAEHHFLGDYCNAAAPDMLLAAMARETKRIGLGFGIVPLPIHDPVRVAERLATLDILSDGRVHWGVGRGVTVTELEGFGVDPADSRDVFRRRFTELGDILRTGQFTRDGERYELRPPPGPRLGTGWLAAVSPESFELAAELGLNAMTGPFKPWPFVKEDLKRYRRLAARSPAPSGGATSFTLAVYCAEDHEAARARAEPGLLWIYRKILEVSRPLLAARTAGYEHYRKLGRLASLFDDVLTLRVLEAMGLAAVGNPEHVAKRLASLQASGLDRVNLMIGGGDLSAGESVDCLQLLAERVLPAVESGADAAEAAPA
ncbi:MAG: LLM class flavin-dependent oxidoreductase [Rhodospirillales bacterium]|nr:LLM class flavin-dependent oxidoreductase [Rhodospirillales bacterium]MDH3910118.1 LLM class flavin-dependent oxidoreductase [Rhodospirillales bacterium]MDH3916817.1 LLM class flavin-dependent oxidoreductase [Rhodospirillales bacterium]MDH3965924.1 LLM class flavin-dependent oxidoreductase [Rhodospirillales bacterium]